MIRVVLAISSNLPIIGLMIFYGLYCMSYIRSILSGDQGSELLYGIGLFLLMLLLVCPYLASVLFLIVNRKFAGPVPMVFRITLSIYTVLSVTFCVLELAGGIYTFQKLIMFMLAAFTSVSAFMLYKQLWGAGARQEG